MAETLAPYIWIPPTIAGFMALVTNTILLHKERNKRKSGSNGTNASTSTVYTSTASRVLPIMCIICTMLYAFTICVGYFQGFCRYRTVFVVLLISAQGTIMGFYQLSRLYYIASAPQIHSSIGYPKWLFIVMYILGGAYIVIATLMAVLTTTINEKCGINEKLEYYPAEAAMMSNEKSSVSVICSIAFYISWDAFTLFLFVYKVLQFRYRMKNIEQAVRDRVMSVLNRILILTLFYEFFMVLFLICVILERVNENMYPLVVAATLILTTSVSLSMFLMQPHSDKEYHQFLRIIYGMKLYYLCCCCCQSMIQRDMLRVIGTGPISEDPQHLDVPAENGAKEMTMFDTATDDLPAPVMMKEESVPTVLENRHQ